MPPSGPRFRARIEAREARIRPLVPEIRRLIGVYNARGTLGGELAYVLGKITGRVQCSLCDITHGFRLRERGEWRARRAGLAIPFETIHRHERSPDVVRACPNPPCVLADTDEGVVPLLGPAEIDACAGNIDALLAAVDRAVADRGLSAASVDAA